MSTQQAAPSRGRTNLTFAALFLGMFVLGSAGLLVVGVLNLIAIDLGVSIPAAGVWLTASALGLAVGGPLLTALTIRLNRRTLLIGTLALFALANLIPVLLPNYALLCGQRRHRLRLGSRRHGERHPGGLGHRLPQAVGGRGGGGARMSRRMRPIARLPPP
jgi:MFS family permease